MPIINMVYKPKKPRLPSEYKEVKYIETTWTQYINTWMSPWSNIQTETKIEVTTTEWSLSVFWWTNEHWLAMSYYWLSTSTTKWTWGLSRAQPSWWTYSPTIWNQYEIVYNNTDSQLNINWDNAGSTSWTTCINWYIIAISRRSNSNGKFKFFYFKMYNKDTQQYERDFVPCYRKSDGEIWMYDLVNDQFYTNNWTWTFIKWPNA